MQRPDPWTLPPVALGHLWLLAILLLLLLDDLRWLAFVATFFAAAASAAVGAVLHKGLRPHPHPWTLTLVGLGNLWVLVFFLLLLLDLRWLAYVTTAVAVAASAAVGRFVHMGLEPRPHPPWTLTGLVLGNLWALGAAVATVNVFTSLLPAGQALSWLAWMALTIAFLASGAVAAFIATVLALGSARCREEGPSIDGQTYDVQEADSPYHILATSRRYPGR